MCFIAALGTALPDFSLPQEEAKRFARHHFAMSDRDADRLLPVFDHAGVHHRHLGATLEWLEAKPSFAQKNERYQTIAAQLAFAAASCALLKTQYEATDIDALIYVTSTGIATPSLDVHLITDLGLRDNVARLPLWGLGCAGGAVGLARAADWTQAHPDSVVLVVCVELCSLTFISDDRSTRNLVGAALFGDGAAAAILVGEARADRAHTPYSETGQVAPARVIGARSHLFADTRDIMGWDIRDEGLAVVFSRDIPTFVTKELGAQVAAMLEQFGLTRNQLVQFIAHPGGAKVLTAYAKALDCPDQWLHHASAVLSQHGNMSSPTVLFVLERVLEERRAAHEPPPQGYGILAALGPGFSCEQILLAL